MKNETKVKEKVVIKKCSICNKEIHVTIYPDRTYRGGNFFCKLDGEVKGEKIEYWECDKCFNEP